MTHWRKLEETLQAKLKRYERRIKELETFMADKMVTVPQSFVDNVGTLLDNVTTLGDKVDGLTTQMETLGSVTTSAQAEISTSIQDILARTGPVPNVDVADLINKIAFANSRITDEVAKTATVHDQVTDFGQAVQGYADQIKAQDVPSDTAPSDVSPAEATPGANSAPPMTNTDGSNPPTDMAPAGSSSTETQVIVPEPPITGNTTPISGPDTA